MLRAFLLTLLALLLVTYTYAQEEKETKKVIKLKVETDDDGNVSIDTTIILDGEFDGDWKTLIDDEEVLEKLKNIEIEIEEGENGESKVMVWTSDDGEHEFMHDVMLEELEGDSVKVIVLTTDGGEENIEVITKKEVIVIRDGKDDGKKGKKKKDRKK